MSDVAFPLGALAVILAVVCLLGIHDSREQAKVRAYGHGLVGACLVFAVVVIAAAVWP